MIIFISEYPNHKNERDGMIQRVLAMDHFFEDQERIYLHVSLKQNLVPKFSRKSANLSIVKINIFLHFIILIYYLVKAKIVYVHSIYNSIKILPFYYLKCIITDMHGVVPEELMMNNHKIWAKIFGLVESIVIRKSHAIITVTNSMKEHLKEKYRLNSLKAYIIPIFDVNNNSSLEKIYFNSKLTVIYAGGTQKWQNVDLMINFIKSQADKYNFIILTNDVDTFRSKFLFYQVNTSNIQLKSVSKDEVYSYYRDADLGFVLRDDSIVNRVACPTKLIEYMSYGVIPVVIQPLIGDFLDYGYKYITLNDFLHDNRIPDKESLVNMRTENYKIIKRIESEITQSISILKKELMLSTH